MNLSNYERETVITYNQEEKNAVIYTHDPALIRKLDLSAENGEAITLLRQGDGWREYELSKKYIKVRFPRKLSDEQRAELASRMKALRADGDSSECGEGATADATAKDSARGKRCHLLLLDDYRPASDDGKEESDDDDLQ